MKNLHRGDDIVQDFRKLDVWKKAHALSLAVYRETKGFPPGEVFGMTMQLRRSAVAIATRIAEGCGRDGNVEFVVDLRKAKASCSELEYAMLLAHDLGLIADEVYERMTSDTVEVRKMIHGLLKSL
jgi:four helix bundle protein